jgi:hypothetical protein
MSHVTIQFEGGTIPFSITGTSAQIESFIAGLAAVKGVIAPGRNTHVLSEDCAWFNLQLERGANPAEVTRQLEELASNLALSNETGR